MRELSISTKGATPQQVETAKMIEKELRYPSVSKLEIWMEDGEHCETPTGEMGVSVTDDGMTMVGFFGTNGELAGDWA